MPDFSPFHAFGNGNRLERLVAGLHDGGNVGDDIWQAHTSYHWALLYKLTCAKHHVERLGAELEGVGIARLTDPDFLFAVNLSIDGFFYAGGSALDILAREVLVYFDISLPALVYYETARNRLGADRPGDAMIARMADPSWLREFKLYRNALTHELMVANSVNASIVTQGPTSSSSIVVPLPNNPRVTGAVRGNVRNPDALEYVRTHMRRLLSCVNTVYGDLACRIQSNGGLPL